MLLSIFALLSLTQFTPLPKTPPTRPVASPKSTEVPPAKLRPAASAYVGPTFLWKAFVKRGDATGAVALGDSYVAAGEALIHLDSEGRPAGTNELGATQSEVAVDEKRIYVGTERGTIYAIDRKTGTIAWKYVGASGAVRMAPALSLTRIVFESLDGAVYCLDNATGALKWKFNRPDGSLGFASPVINGNYVYVCGESVVYRLSFATGKEDWRMNLGGRSLTTPVLAGGRLYVAGDGNGLNALDPETGQRLLRIQPKTENGQPEWFGTPLVFGKSLYITTYGRSVYALELPALKIRWTATTLGPALSKPALDAQHGIVFVSSGTYKDNPTLTGFTAGSGLKVWEQRLGYVATSPVITENRLYVGSMNGYYYAFSLD